MIDRTQSTLRHAVRGIVKVLSAALLACGLTQLSSAATPVLPATKPGQLVGDWMELCRSPNLAQMTKWLTANLSEEAEKRFPAADRAQGDVELCAVNGGFRAEEVTKSEPNVISVRSIGVKSGVWFTQTFILNGAGKLDRTGLFPSAPVESALPTDLSDAAIASEVKS